MRRSLALIAGLMLALTLWTGVSISAAHAAEIVGCAEFSIDGEAHGQDRDGKVPFGPDGPAPHHHGCLSHYLSVPVLHEVEAITPIPRIRWRIGSASEPESIAGASDLRPPIA